MEVIKFTNLEQKSMQDRPEIKTFPNTPDGLEKLGKFLLEKYYIPYRKRHDFKDAGFDDLFMINARKQGIPFLALDRDFFKFDLCIAEIEPDSAD